MYFKVALVSSALLAAELVAGHGAIIKAVTPDGGESMALGVNPDTPRDGTRRNPNQQDSTRFQGSTAGSTGETLEGGANDVETGTKAIMQMTGQPLAQIRAGGEITMTVHQVNADGAGPYECMINADGTAEDWQNIEVTQNVPGNERGRNRDGNMSDIPLKVAVPAGQHPTFAWSAAPGAAAPGAAAPAAGAAGANRATAAGAAPGAAGALDTDTTAATGATGAQGKKGRKNRNNKRAAFIKSIDPVTRAVTFTA
ncbi:hypothetical protein HIM_04563 [Hirsutella minnesotensis 3608]|uniref:Uncharacterized protein n=1 Tax=Hirsutella minnesotensis 3608 TaxID=1043627 RepID=A0A0F8A1C6_9HYPO|nr:hypothetical protein HIM_04563 [Hirsutella minnesotensis 3608]